mmetsp:Transcript_29049/g.42832  ORF Transcript_29049/g.42832 Transcript_29049/m.42832 type:complete len:84 (+) Transcript_29049:73-324(+)
MQKKMPIRHDRSASLLDDDRNQTFPSCLACQKNTDADKDVPDFKLKAHIYLLYILCYDLKLYRVFRINKGVVISFGFCSSFLA